MNRSMIQNEPTRRAFVETLAKTALGVTVLGGGQFCLAQSKPKATADACILLMMNGGMPHLDTFDPKPENSDVMGKTGVISTSITGEKFGENVPELAKLADKLAIVRSMFQKTADHRQATYTARTGYSMRPTIIHPSLGPWAQRLLGKKNELLPDSVNINTGVGHPGQGFLDPSFSPLPVGDPKKGVPNMNPFGIRLDTDAKKKSYESTLDRRLALTEKLDATFREAATNHEKVKAYTQFYDETLKFLRSEDLKLFNLAEEPEAVRTRYGDNQFGQGCLLAKRLVKGGVRFVEVAYGNWDTHVDHFERTPELAGVMDRSAANLIRDLEAEGMLDRTLVVLATEFGRTPRINGNSGRDHHSQAYSHVLTGGGIKGGNIVGKSDSSGTRLETKAHEPKDINASIAHALGIDLNAVVKSPTGRPFTVATHTSAADGKIITNGHPIMELFS